MFEALPSFRSSLHPATRAVLALGLMTWATISAATDIHVPADQPTIQQAIAAAKRGDRVVVSPGTYYENVYVFDKVVDLVSTDGAALTTIDGGGSGTVVSLFSRHKGKVLLQGFTIAHGKQLDGETAGGGITVRGKLTPTIQDNIFEYNSAYGGGAILLGGSAHAQIKRNTFRHNSATSEGGAMLLSTNSESTVDGNIFEYNEAGFGAALFSTNSRLLTIKDNVFRSNSAADNGGAMYVFGGSVVIADNLIHDNRAGGDGAAGGVIVDVPRVGQSTSLVNNTFARNKGTVAELYARASPSGSLQAANNIFLTTHGRTSVSCDKGKHGMATFSHNLVFSTSGARIEGDCDVAGGGLLTVDPMFVGGDDGNNRHAYRLSPGSPAIDAGDDSAVHEKRDFTGAQRIQGAAVDLGAIEFRVD